MSPEQIAAVKEAADRGVSHRSLSELLDMSLRLTRAEERLGTSDEALQVARQDASKAYDQLHAQQAELANARAVLGDGWVPLRCGGSVLVIEGRPKKIRDNGNPECRRETLRQAAALCGGLEDTSWAEDGTMEISEEIPF